MSTTRNASPLTSANAQPSGGRAGATDSALFSDSGLALAKGGGASGLDEKTAQRLGETLARRDPKLFQRMDADGDGRLSLRELLAKPGDAVRMPAPAISDTDAAAMSAALRKGSPALFRSLDANGDRQLGAKELVAGRDAIAAYVVKRHQPALGKLFA
ncbi:MAG TPA: EF-hand domain-containing protein [Planctomycetota bacterium]|nr:EF-hand domain-containing protein [Planctomycetota bacterium]